MRHRWIFDVLTDLRCFAQMNGFPGLGAKADEALQVAKRELAADAAQSRDGDSAGDATPDRPSF